LAGHTEADLEKIKRVMLGLALFLLLSGCVELGSLTGKKIKYPGEVTSALQTEFDQIEAQYRRHQFDSAYSGYRGFVTAHVYNALTDEAYYKQGKILFIQGNFPAAMGAFSVLEKNTPSLAYKSKARHMIAYSHYKNRAYAQALDVLQKTKSVDLPDKLQVQFYSLAILSAQKLENTNDFADFSLFKLFDLYEDSGTLQLLQAQDVISYASVKSMMQTWMAKPLSSAQITPWMKRYPRTAGRSYVLYKMGKIYQEEGNPKKARTLLSQLLEEYPKNPYASSAEKLLATLGGPVETTTLKHESFKVGLVLPLTDQRLSSYAQAVLDGARCAASMCGDNTGIELIVKDSGSTPESARLAVEELDQQKVAAIVGPLSGDLAIEAGIAATERKVPIFPITQKSHIMEQGAYIFQIGMTTEQEIDTLARRAHDQGLKRLAILYPSNEYGQKMKVLFGNAVNETGGQIVVSVAYSPASSDLFADVRKLKMNMEEGGDATELPFDAIFIPDSFKAVNNLVGALTYNHIGGIPLLGTSAWNDPNLSSKIALEFPGSFFVSIYDSHSNNDGVVQFKEDFLRGFGRSPRVLEAYGYDAVQMIHFIAARRGASHIYDALSGGQGFSGVTGIVGFRPGDEPIVEGKVVRISGNGL
jgi:ABC-type branched-subunit amino acid transport system substrate-binding protein